MHNPSFEQPTIRSSRRRCTDEYGAWVSGSRNVRDVIIYCQSASASYPTTIRFSHINLKTCLDNDRRSSIIGSDIFETFVLRYRRYARWMRSGAQRTRRRICTDWANQRRTVRRAPSVFTARSNPLRSSLLRPGMRRNLATRRRSRTVMQLYMFPDSSRLYDWRSKRGRAGYILYMFDV